MAKNKRTRANKSKLREEEKKMETIAK